MPETIGQQLKKARLEQGLTHDQVSRVLHIRPVYLVALEEDRRKNLPSAVQGKGFLRMYADYLHLPVQPLLDAWDGILPAEPAPVQSPEPELEALPEPEIPLLAEPPAQAPETSLESLAEEPELSAAEPGNPSGEISGPPTAAVRETAAQSSFEDVGLRLKHQRQALNLSIPEVERYTHVRQHYLEALEEGRIEDLPSPVQGRGMLSNYAHFLNLDVEGLLLEFAEGLQSRRMERVRAQPSPKKASQRTPSKPAQPQKVSRRLLSRDLLVSTLLVFMILAFALWTASQVDALNNSRKAELTPPSIADVLLSNPSPTPKASATPTQQAILSTLAPGEVQPLGGNQAPVTPETALTVPVSGDAPLQVYVVAHERAYLRVTVDDKVVFDGRVVPGNAYPFGGLKKIELLTGSAAAIQVYFNQEDLGVLGLVGQVKAYEFTKDGAVTPTPQFTATPTRTEVPTSTSQPTATLPAPTITPYIP